MPVLELQGYLYAIRTALGCHTASWVVCRGVDGEGAMMTGRDHGRVVPFLEILQVLLVVGADIADFRFCQPDTAM